MIYDLKLNYIYPAFNLYIIEKKDIKSLLNLSETY